ncbi:hypothetical protein [Streptomyces sp. CRN 30]|uniref:hypothetical protein n=1 Tax=Streptomyces sp. CRN 30 TaxID=3075613 RepID=UPI002A7EC399|nr:hypothetical protein [Streptomyces sp. CRN 30]
MASTADAGTATVTFEVDSGRSNALYVSPYRFSLDVQDGTGRITLYDKNIYERLMSKLPLVGGPVNRWRLHYDITDAASGNPVTSIPAIDPLTGTTLASNPSVTVENPLNSVPGVVVGIFETLPEVIIDIYD